MTLYIHIPFCRQACSYCDFHFSVNHSRMDEMVIAITEEIKLRKNYLSQAGEKPKLDSVYFGGGTPSLLCKDQLNIIFESITNHYTISPGAEITLEANPDDLTNEKLFELKQIPVNRLSIGVQSFVESDLRLMNRAHNESTARQSILDAAAAGFSNLTIDLIYGVPGMGDEHWKQNLEIAFQLPVNHLSCYSLTIEKKTVLDKMIREGKLNAPDDEVAANHFIILMQQAAANGFDHYEISNFAKPGFYSRHNSSYWKNIPYIGIGPSAHSYNGISRQWNVSGNAAYIDAIREGIIPATEEILTKENRYNEYLMTGLRTKWGVDLKYIHDAFGDTFEKEFLTGMSTYIKSGELIPDGTHFSLSQKGKLIADRIAAKGFVV